MNKQPSVIYLQPEILAGLEGRLWCEDDLFWDECDDGLILDLACDAEINYEDLNFGEIRKMLRKKYPATQYIRADLVYELLVNMSTNIEE